MSDLTKREAGKDTLMQLVSFMVGEDEFGVDIHRVQEINRVPQLVRIQDVPDYVDGVLNFWGRVVPVVNLRRRFGMPPKEWDESTRIIVVEKSRKQIGFIVDVLQEIVRVPTAFTEPPPVNAGPRAEYVTSVARMKDRMLNVFDLDRVFGREQVVLSKGSSVR